MKVLVCTLALLISAFCANGVDLSTLASVESFKCLKDNGVSFMVMRGYRSYGAVDPNVKQVIKNAQEAGIDFSHVYMFPCRSKPAADQVNELLDYLAGSFFGYLYLDIETNTSPGCGWGNYTSQQNCEYIGQLIDAVENRDQAVGIYASRYMWTQILGSPDACPNYSSYPLWYAHYDGIQSFDDFVPFGGWTFPNVKQYKGTTAMCGTSVDLNWYHQC